MFIEENQFGIWLYYAEKTRPIISHVHPPLATCYVYDGRSWALDRNLLVIVQFKAKTKREKEPQEK